jgi:hypothetical protein
MEDMPGQTIVPVSILDDEVQRGDFYSKQKIGGYP